MAAIMTGIGVNSENNPFTDWSVRCIGYASSDFYIGSVSESYVDGNGGLTIHTLIVSDRVFDDCMDGVSAPTRIMNAVNGNLKSVGLNPVE